jgi:Lon protease-like protein
MKPAVSPGCTMDFDSELHDFSNRCRLFPLPDVLLFPHVLLPLHIFEPRYRQMTEDALASDRLVTMVQIRPATEATPWPEPVPIMEVGCVGKIVQYQRLDDGCFNFLLLGCKRVRLVREIPSSKLYRIAEAEIMEDEEPAEALDRARQELIQLFRVAFGKRHPLNKDLRSLLAAAVPLGVLSDIITHALGLPSAAKQELLAEPRVDHRVQTLRLLLRQIADRGELSRVFPPEFSAN